ncbi:MAG: TonB family protein [Bacteroidales bacterium]|nr:TonB family protein [Bacteroidales bacterium]
MQAIITATAIYALKAAIALALLYTPYIFFMRRETLFRTNRTTLLLAMLLSLAIPFIDIPALHIENPFTTGEIKETTIIIETASQQEFLAGETVEENIKSLTPEEKAYYFLCLPYIIIALIIVAKKSYELYTIKRHIRRGTLWLDERKEYTIYCHASTTTPYSWMKSIVISQEDYENFGKEIILHEEGHILHRHSWDMLLLAAAESLQWFNPFIHMLATDLKDIHEFQADAYVLQKGQNSKEYQMLIIKKAVSHASYTLANSFNHSNNLKKRITMMLKKKSNSVKCATALYILPAAALTLSLFASPQETVGNNLADESASVHKSSETFAKSDTVEQKVYHFTEKGASGEKVYQFVPDDTEEEIIYKVCEIMPKIADTGKELPKELFVSIEYPGKDKKISAAYINFIVNTDGSKSDIRIMKSSGHEPLDKAALIAVEKMPKLEPGTQGGKKVRVQMTIPVYGKAMRRLSDEELKATENPTNVQMTISKEAKESDVNNAKDKIYTVVEQVAQFPGGNNAMFKFLADNLRYPEDAKNEEKEGRTIIKCVIDTDGSLSDIKVVKSSGHESLDKEAMRVVAAMPKWEPGMQGGEKVKSSFAIPIQFRLK